MKFQIMFSGKNQKIISKCHLLKILPRVLSVNAKAMLQLTLMYAKQFRTISLYMRITFSECKQSLL